MIEIVFENKQLIVVDKPPNWLTTPAREAGDARPCLGRALQERLGQQIFPVHRLDFEVSGLVMFAKTRAVHRAAQGWFELGVIQKTYRALTKGGPRLPDGSVEWRTKLAKGKRRAFLADHGKVCVTGAAAERAGELVRWTLEPRTGRPHQLRFELGHRGWPILGDVLYGGTPWAGGDGIALRAWRLNFAGVSDRFGLPPVIEGADLY